MLIYVDILQNTKKKNVQFIFISIPAKIIIIILFLILIFY